MLTMSKPLSAGQARRYHAEEFRNARANYYTAGDRVVGHWHGQLAAQWGLTGEVGDEHFERLAEGQHPLRVGARQPFSFCHRRHSLPSAFRTGVPILGCKIAAACSSSPFSPTAAALP